MKGWIAGTLLAVLAAAAVGAGVIAQEAPPDPTPEPVTETTANVEVRVWQDVRDALSIYISARPEDGSWATLGTIPLPLDDGHSGSGRFRYGDITVAVPVGSGEKDVEVRVWQDVRDALSIYISARPEGGSWATLGTIPLPLDDGHSGSGRFRYGDITVEVPVPLPPAPTATPTPTPTPTPWVDPRPADTYTLAELAAMPAPRAPQPPPLPDHELGMHLGGGSYDLDEVWLFLIEDTARINSISFSLAYNSRSYPVICNTRSKYGRFICKFSENGPINRHGTARLSLSDTIRYGYGLEAADYTLVSVTLDGSLVRCEERPSAGDRRTWWCYDPATYRAWEAARDRALALPDDPLQRYLRQQGDPPLWYDALPTSGVGDYMTGVFRLEPYVTYKQEVTHDTRNPVRNIEIRCIAEKEPATGYRTISRETWRTWTTWRWETDAGPGRFFVRSAALCELQITADGAWTVDLAPVED